MLNFILSSKREILEIALFAVVIAYINRIKESQVGVYYSSVIY